GMWTASGPDLPVAEHHVLERGEAFQSHGTARVQLVGGDADLRAEAVLVAVGEAGRRVDDHRARVDLAQEALRALRVLGDDRVGVLRAVGGDVLYRLLEPVHDPHGEDRVEILGVPVFLDRRLHPRHDAARRLVAAQLYALRLVDRREPRQDVAGDGARDEERFHGVA